MAQMRAVARHGRLASWHEQQDIVLSKHRPRRMPRWFPIRCTHQAHAEQVDITLGMEGAMALAVAAVLLVLDHSHGAQDEHCPDNGQPR